MAQQPRPATLTLKELQGAVSAAVKAAAAAQKVHVENNVAIGPGIIMGPLLRAEGVTAEAAQAVATHVAEAAQKALAGHAAATALTSPLVLQPGYTRFGRIIICGFWPPPGWPIEIGEQF